MSDTGPCYCSECSSSILKRTRAQRSIHWPRATGLHCVYLPGEKKEGWQGCVSWPGMWPTHRHRYLTWAELSASSTATTNILATYPAVPRKQCRLGLLPGDVEFYCHHLHFAVPADHISPSITSIPAPQAQQNPG